MWRGVDQCWSPKLHQIGTVLLLNVSRLGVCSPGLDLRASLSNGGCVFICAALEHTLGLQEQHTKSHDLGSEIWGRQYVWAQWNRRDGHDRSGPKKYTFCFFTSRRLK
ncbi:hypothetical protein RRG08_047166 [Elysia crispata]|uniref:Uncharacterized protein n=1 Tax=Elysia crispata TaxID=231223 RepID=A0AAE1D1L6_9GAST|nr:hypothetical protein RRG08_047166 [Elysia crispata]